jgi:hypothetical protein
MSRPQAAPTAQRLPVRPELAARLWPRAETGFAVAAAEQEREPVRVPDDVLVDSLKIRLMAWLLSSPVMAVTPRMTGPKDFTDAFDDKVAIVVRTQARPIAPAT